MTSGQRSHMPKPFGSFGAGPPYARPAPPTRSCYAPCLPSKRALLPQLTAGSDLPHPWSSTPRRSPLPTRTQPTPLLPLHPTGLETSPDSSLTPLPHLPNSPSPLPSPSATRSHTQHVSPERGGRTRGPHLSPCAIFIVIYEPDKRKVRIIF